MAKKTINLGTPNGKDGDIIRDALKKVNDNFDELYTLTGGTAAELTELAQDYAAAMFTNGTHTGITVTYDDDNNRLNLSVPAGFSGAYADLTGTPTIPDLSAVNQNIIPDTNVAYDLGSPTNRFRDLYLSGNTIDLGGALITATDDGNVSLPGVTETRFKPGSIEDTRQPGETFFNESALPEDSVIIDQATWIWAAVGGNQSGGTFQPSVYSAAFNGSGFITAISIVEANYYDDTNDWATINRDNLYVVPAGTLLTAQSISAVGSPIGVLAAAVISTSESIANIPTLTIPTDIGDLTDTGNLLGSGTGDITFDGIKIQGAGTASGDGNGYSTIELVPDTGLYNNDQYLIIDPTAPSHIHIRAGGTQDASNAELYLGGEKNNVRINDGVGVRLYNEVRDDTFSSFSDPADFNTATWYGTPGNYFVEFTEVTAGMGNLAFTFSNDAENRVTVSYGAGESSVLTYGGSTSNLGGGVYRFAVVEAPPASPTALTGIEFQIWTTNNNRVELQNNDFTVSVKDDVRITGNDLFSLRNTSPTDPITIRTDYDGADRGWEFAADGTLSTPGDIVVNGDVTGTAGGSTLVLRAEPGSNTAIQLNDIVDSEIRTVANLEIRTDVTNTPRVWTFGTDGGLTFPDATIQTTAYPGPITFLNGDVKGSVFADDSTILVDGVSGVLRANVNVSNTWTVTTGDKTWSFIYGDVGEGTTPTLEFPGNLQAAGSQTALFARTGDLSSNWGMSIDAGNSPYYVDIGEISGSNYWRFSGDGSLTLPGELHGAPVISGGAFPSQVGRTVNITPADDAIDKKFKFRIDQYGETFTRAYLEFPTAEVDKQVAAVFPHTNGKAGYIYTQGNDTNGQGMNDAFNIFYNNGDIKITSMGSLGGLYTWKFGDSGDLTIPGDIQSEEDISIRINLADSTTRIWRFGEDGDLTFPDTTVQSTAFTTSPTLNILKIDDGVHEKFQTKSNATGTVTHDCSSGHIFYHTLPSANWTVNLTNLNLAVGYATTVTLVIEQGATGYYPNAIQIDGNGVGLAWQGNTTPTPSSSRTDVVTFSILYDGLYTVLGQLTGF